MPTWNYIAVHAYGTLSLVEDDPGKEALLAELIATNEPAYLDRWRALAEVFAAPCSLGIMGFRIPIARIEGKFKLSQNRKPEERRNVHAAHAAGSPDQQALARWMERLAPDSLRAVGAAFISPRFSVGNAKPRTSRSPVGTAHGLRHIRFGLQARKESGDVGRYHRPHAEH